MNLICMGDSAISVFMGIIVLILGFKKSDAVIKRIGLGIICLGLGIAMHCLSEPREVTPYLIIVTMLFALSLGVLLCSLSDWVSGKIIDDENDKNDEYVGRCGR